MQSVQSKLNVPQTFFTPGQGGPIPSTDRVVSNCSISIDFDACLFRKNVVAQEGKPVAQESLDSYRRFGVKIRGIPDSIYLENQWLRVFTVSSPRVSLYQATRFKESLSDKESVAEQVSAYYWANRLFEYLSAQVGSERIPALGLSIYPDDAFTGYVAKTKSIHLEKSANRSSRALQGDVVVHLVGEALADTLSSQRLFPSAPAQHKNCSSKPNGCCASSLGCGSALASAFGDYVAGMLFPESARLGEALVGSVNGQSLCGWTRDLRSVANTSVASAYTACSDFGHVTVMGLWYAGQWWAMRQAVDPIEVADVDILFFEHAKNWRASSTFQDAKRSAYAVATSYKSGKYLALVQRYLP